MADLVLQQVVSVIDSRTTTICLHAAGQIQPVGKPFDTLVGEQYETPFHWHCRSMIVPWMPGFVSDIRKTANAELVRRPLAERRIGPGGVGKLPKPRPRAPKLPERLYAAPPKGLDALTPDTPIGLVPPTLRKQFMEAHPTRFELTSNGGGISESYWVKDLQTGDRYVLKAGKYHKESAAEVIGTRIGAEVGLPGEVLIASDMASGNGWVLLKHAEDIDDLRRAGYKVVGTGGGHKKIAKMLPRLEDPGEAVKKLLVDFVTDEADAKGGNLLLLSKDGGKTVRLVPIDRSLSQMGWRNAIEKGKTNIVVGDWTLAGRLKVTDLRGYMKTRGSPKGVLDLIDDIAAQPGGKKIIVDAYDETVDALKRIDLDVATSGMSPGLVVENRRLIADRIRLIEEKRTVMLRQMGVADVDDLVSGPIVEAAGARAQLQIDKGRAYLMTQVSRDGTRKVRLKFPRDDIDPESTLQTMLSRSDTGPGTKATLRALGKISDDYPTVMDRIEYVQFGELKGGQFAGYTHATKGMSISSSKTLMDGGLDARVAHLQESGWFSKAAVGSDAHEYVLTHEIGHAMDQLLEEAGKGRTAAWPTMWREIGKEMRKFDDSIKSGTSARKAVGKHGGRLVSEYGSKSEREFIAEAFAEYRLAKNPRPVARIVGEAFEKAFGSNREI